MTNPNTTNTSSTASAALTGLYYDYSIPLPLFNLIQQTIVNTQSNPNTPVVASQRAPREWFSQPAPAVQGTSPRVTVFLVDGTHDLLDINNEPTIALPDNPLMSVLSGLLDPSTCVIQTIEWPVNLLPMYNSIYTGKAMLEAAIQTLTTPFILVGYSQGAMVTSLVLEEIQSGTLTQYQNQLIAGVTFGNPMRASGQVASVQTDPGGTGIWTSKLLPTTPDYWWDFALPGDEITAAGDTDVDTDLEDIFTLAMTNYVGGDIQQFLLNNAASLPANLFQQAAFVLNLIFIFLWWPLGPKTVTKAAVTELQELADAPHASYYNTVPPGANQTCVALAAKYINQTADEWQAAYVFRPPTEVLQINFKLPLSVGQLGFKVLRVPCTVQAWYRDRNNNWIQLVDDATNPISVSVALSQTTSWFNFQTNVYPVVATAIQLRLTRNYDPQVGNTPYVVGLKETLIQRFVYSLDDTKLAIADQQDQLGNTITAYVKDWGPNNVLDNNPSTYWKSFPCPDPNGVVCLYLDTRDATGDAQLIDTVYIDPVYTGNTLNLYYSNDSTQGTLILNSVNLPPDTQVNSTWALGVGMSDTSGPDLAESQLLFPTNFGPFVQQPMWVGLEWTPNFPAGDGPGDNPVLFGVYPTVNTVQLITINGAPTGGSFPLTYIPTEETTSGIAYNASASDIQTALEALDGIGADNVSVSGADGGPWEIEFIGTFSGTDVPALSAGNALTGGTAPAVEVDVTTIGYTPSYLSEDTYWPVIYYDVGAGEIVLEFTNGTTTHVYTLALSPAFSSLLPLEVVVGWDYDPDVVMITVTQGRIQALGSIIVNPATNLPNTITLDGTVGYKNFSGLMSATVVKAEPWFGTLVNNAMLPVTLPFTLGEGYSIPAFNAFQINSTLYANPNPVQPDSNGNYPSTSLDNAILAVDWTSQSMPLGGTDESWYENKVWTPIFEDYITEKGNLYLPQAVSMSYLCMEFSNLTPEPYPVYDQGITVRYDTFPVSATQTSTNTSNIPSTYLTLTSDIPTNSIGSVNWFNPSTIQQAINANWGQTQQPVTVQSGPGTATASLPNTTQANIAGSYRNEASSPWIYNRQTLNPTYLAGQYLTGLSNSQASQTMQNNTLAGAAQSVAGGAPSTANTSTNPSVSNPSSNSTQTLAYNFQPVTQGGQSNVLPQQGQDWWLFPGANLKMPATTMQALTGTNTVTARGPSNGSVRPRFASACVHRYNSTTLVQDAAVAYFAGLAEVQPYVTHYVAANDPASFQYSQYDPTTFTYTNVNQLPTGPATTDGSPYVFDNPNFEYPLELEPWTATGEWFWDSTGGLGFGGSDQACAAVTANGTHATLVSEPIAVSPGDEIEFTAMVSYAGVTSSSSATLSISAITYETGTPTSISLSMPATTATYTVSNQAAMLAESGAVIDDSTTITTGEYQGTYTLINTPPATFANWVQTGYGTQILNPTGNIDGNIYTQLRGTYTVPGSGVDHMSLVLNVDAGVSAGTIYWNNATMNPIDGIEGMLSFTAETTSTFADMTVAVSDSGLMNSDSMWAQLDPQDTNINNLQLAPYVSTIPSVVPSGFWGDQFASWDDLTIDWGEPQAVVAITIDPNLVFSGNRAMHFQRAAGAGEAGITVVQQTNLLPQELAQLGVTFYKPTANDNQVIIRLRRTSDGVYVHEETFSPPYTGVWYTYLGSFFELPNNTDQVYTLELVLSGDDADELYVSNLFTNVAGIRYFFQLGDSGSYDFDITPLAYGDNCSVSCTTPVNQFSLTVGIFNPNCWAYGIALTPRYLK